MSKTHGSRTAMQRHGEKFQNSYLKILAHNLKMMKTKKAWNFFQKK